MHTVLSTAAVVGVFTVATLTTATADLLAASEAPEGFRFTEEIVELDYDEFAVTSPYSVGHVEPGSVAATELRAGQDVWNAGSDATLLREVVVWPDEEVAEAYVDEVVSYAGEEDLTEVEPPFDGARAFAGRDDENDVSVRMVVWRHGLVGAAVSHFHYGDDPGADAIRAATIAFADGITATSGFVITLAPPEEEPTVVPDSTSPDTGTTTSSGGIPITTVLLWLVIIGGGIWLFVKIRRKLRGDASEQRRDRSADEIIDEARARGRESHSDTSDASDSGDTTDSSDRSTDDIVAEARRRARREVDEASDLDIDF